MAAGEGGIVAFTAAVAALAVLLILPPGIALAWLLARRGVAGGPLLAFARALGEFGATILVAGNIPGRTTTLSLAIYNLVQLGKDDEAFRLLAWAVGIAFLAVWCGEAFLRRTLDGA